MRQPARPNWWYSARLQRGVGGLGMAGLSLVLAGCTLGPDAQRPPSVAEEAEQFVNVPADQAEQAMPDLERWWRQFNDPVLNELVQTALEQNTDLREAAARVMESQAILGISTGERWPFVDAGFSRGRNQSTFDFGQGRDSAITTTYTLDAAVSWQVDLFGRLRRQQEAEWFRLLASEANREAVLHSVVAEVVRLRAMIATLQRELAIARSRTESFQQTYELIQERFEQDLANALEVHAARENLEESRAAVPPLEFDLRAARHALDVLLAQQPGTGEPLPETLAVLPPQDSPPVGVPAALLDRRPDLRDTALRARAEQAEIGVAIAELFPDLTLSASAGYQAGELNDLISPESEIWSLLIDAAMPLFQGGALRANIDRARAQAEILAAQYAGQVLDAMREVEDSLVQQRTTWQRHQYLVRQVQEVRQSLELAQQRYEQGLESLLDVLDVQRRRFNAEAELVRAQQVLWDARIDLYLALGGQWIEEPEEDDAAQASDGSDATPEQESDQESKQNNADEQPEIEDAENADVNNADSAPNPNEKR